MKSESDKIDQIFLWLLLAAGFVSLLLYGLSSFVAAPKVETITIHAADTNTNANKTRENGFSIRKIK